MYNLAESEAHNAATCEPCLSALRCVCSEEVRSLAVGLRVLAGSWSREDAYEAAEREDLPVVPEGARGKCIRCGAEWALSDAAAHAWFIASRDWLAANALTCGMSAISQELGGAAEAVIPPEMWRALQERQAADMRRELDPDDVGSVLRRIRALASKANGVPSMTAGVSLIRHIVDDLLHLVEVPKAPSAVWSEFQAAVQRRHRQALRQAVGVSTESEQTQLVERIVEDASQFGRSPLRVLRELEAKETLAEIKRDGPDAEADADRPSLPQHEADSMAVAWAREHLAAGFPRGRPSDGMILRAVRAYRPPVRPAHRPLKGVVYAEAADRFQELAPLLRELGVTPPASYDSYLSSLRQMRTRG